MKYFSNVTNLKFTWDQVAQAMWQRYPNPYSNHVLSEDTLERYVTPDKKLFTKRLISKTSKIPKWGERIMGFSSCSLCVIEESIVDLKEKTIVTYTRNIGMQKVMLVEEKCTYTKNPENKALTGCKRQAWVSSNMGYGISYAFQAFGLEKFKKSSTRTIKGFEHVLNSMFMPEVERQPQTLKTSAEKVKAATMKAKELAKSKAAPVVASVTGSGTTG